MSYVKATLSALKPHIQKVLDERQEYLANLDKKEEQRIQSILDKHRGEKLFYLVGRAMTDEEILNRHDAQRNCTFGSDLLWAKYDSQERYYRLRTIFNADMYSCDGRILLSDEDLNLLHYFKIECYGEQRELSN